MDLAAPGKRIARFGLYEADLERRVLTKSGFRVKLQDQPFQVLGLLLEHPGASGYRQEIQQKLWPGDTFVEFDDGLNNAIKKLRVALSDSADNPRFIETVPRRGYRFLSEVTFKDSAIPAPIALKSTAQSPTSFGQEIPARQIRMVTRKTSPRRRWLWATLGASIFLVTAALYILNVRLKRSPAELTAKDTIVLADFMNTTGDPVFDDTLKQALAVDLAQSPFLDVASDSRVSETLRLMGRSGGERIGPEVAREVCERMGSKAILAGSISRLGSLYIVGIEAVGCANGDTFAHDQAEAATKEGVLKAVSKVASHMRSKLGESLASLEKFDFPLDTTTNSLEALKAFSLGRRTTFETGEAEAIPFYQHAIQLDPDFALAYTSLGIAYDNLGEVNKASKNLTKAYGLRDRVSERERYRITAMYHSDVTGDLEKEKETCELWKETYPRDMAARGMLGTVYAALGQFEKSNEQFQEAMRLSPESAISYGDSAMTDIALDRFQAAEAALSMAQAKGLDGLIIHENLYSIAFLRGDFGEMKRQVAWAEGRPGSEDQLLALDSDTEAYFGRLGNARKLTRRAVESAVRDDARETAAIWEIDGALREMEVGNLSLARQGVRSALSLAPSRDVKILAALVLVKTGDTAGAKALIRELEDNNPANTILKSYWLPTLKASLEVRSGNPQVAISLLQIAAPYELGQASYLFNMYPAYLRGEAYMMAQNGAAAAVEFEKLLSHPGIEQNEILGALSRLQLARAKVLMNDNDGAQKQYKDFLSLWKDADPGIPILKAARLEYAKLQ